MPDPNRVCDLHHSWRQCQILNPLSKARIRMCVLMDASQVCFCWATMGIPKFTFWCCPLFRFTFPKQAVILYKSLSSKNSHSTWVSLIPKPHYFSDINSLVHASPWLSLDVIFQKDHYLIWLLQILFNSASSTRLCPVSRQKWLRFPPILINYNALWRKTYYFAFNVASNI